MHEVSFVLQYLSAVHFLFKTRVSLLPAAGSAPRYTHKMVGIQSLTIALCVTLIVCTAVLVGSITMTTSNEQIDKCWDVSDRLLEMTRATGDEGVTNCLDSGLTDLQQLAAQYLRTTLDGVSAQLENFLNAPERVLDDLTALAQNQHPDVVSSPGWIDNNLRKVMRTRMDVLYSAGTTQLGYYALPWSPSHPPDAADPMATAWGGSIIYIRAHWSLGLLPTDREPPWLVIESRRGDYLANWNQPGSFGYNRSHSYVGDTDSLGNMKFPGQACQSPTNWAGGGFMTCDIPAETMGEVFNKMIHGALLNAANPSSAATLTKVNEVVFTPLVPNFSYLTLFASRTFTHKDARNVLPKQENRVGAFFASMDGDELQKLFQRQRLPPGSLLYAVDWNRWTGKVGNIIAFNKGRMVDYHFVVPPGSTVGFHLAFLIDIRDHTDMQSNATHQYNQSVIAEHGSWVFDMEQNYTTAAERSDKMYVPWDSKNGTTYWSVTRAVTRRDLTWFVNLLVPRQAVMDTIDASRLSIQTAAEAATLEASRQKAKERKDADKERDKAVYVVAGVVLGSAVGLMALAIILTMRIVAPLYSLGVDMSRVACMDLEAVDIAGSLSRLSEVNAMQKSFRQMVENLVEYRNYMPASVLVTDDEMGSETGTCVSRSNSKHHTEETYQLSSSGLSSTMQTVGGQSTVAAARKRLLDTSVLKKKTISLIAFNLRKWLALVDDLPGQDLMTMHTEIVQVLLHSVQSGKGICDIFSGDRIIACFNAHTAVTTHRPQAVKAAYAAHGRLASLTQSAPTLSLSFAVVSGDSKVGHLGCAGMKRVTIVSGVVPWVVALERYNNAHGYKGLMDGYVAREVQAYYEIMCVDGVLFPKRARESVIKVFEIVESRNMADEEWMYQLQQADQSARFNHWNKAFDHVLVQDFSKARQAMANVPEDAVVQVCCCLLYYIHAHAHAQTLYKRLCDAIENEQYTPVVMQYA